MSSISFDGKAVVVTGAGRGLGRAYAELFAARGAGVVVNDVGVDDNGVSVAQSTAEAIRKSGGKAIAVDESVATADGSSKIVDACIAEFGGIDALVNNAGIMRRMPFAELDLDALDAIWDVNIKGAIRVTKAAWPHLVASSGRIVIATSAAGVLGNYDATAYGTAKAALIGLTRVLALEGAEHGIKVNAIAPRAQTDMAPGGSDAGWTASKLTPALAAPAAVWLAHESCDITGEVLAATAGHVGRFFTGFTPGYFDACLSPESLADNLERVMATTGFTLPASPAEERAIVHQIIKDSLG